MRTKWDHMWAAFLVITIAVFVVVIANTSHGTDNGKIVTCAHEDGSTQDVCQWRYTTPEGAQRVLINHNWGEWTYYPHTGRYITWDSDPSAETVRSAAS